MSKPELDPSIAAAISIIATTIATAILRWTAYMWPPGHHRRGLIKDKREPEEELDNE